jgi:ribonucleoside-diphosphate reductase alpha chain
MTVDRQRLPNRRQSETFGFEHAGLRYTATASWFADGRLGEVFITNGKADSQADSNVRDAAIVASIAMQYGAPLDVICKALLRDGRGRLSTPIGAALDLLSAQESSR